MNSLERHHRDSIRFGYRCFDRMVFNAVIQHLQLPEAVFGFFKRQRGVVPVTTAFLKNLSCGYHTWLERKAEQLAIPVVEPPKGVRRDDWVEPYFQRLGGKDGVAVILKAREPAKMAVSSSSNWVHLLWRHPYVYNLYLQHPRCGRMFLRLCPYFPFNARVCLNGHEWLAQRLRQEGIAFAKRDNAFLDCADPKRLQELADTFGPDDLVAVVDELFEEWLPYFSPQERAQGYRHRPFLAQVEYCDNLIFHKKAALHRLFDRLLDLNRAIGQPDKLAVIFGRQRFHADTRTGKTEITITRLGLPVLRAGFKSTSLKQYVRDGVLLRTETTNHQLKDLSLRKDVRHLPRVRQVFAQSNERLLNAEQDVLETYVDRGQLQQLRQPTISPTRRRTPGLRLDDVRLLAVWQALTGMVHLLGHGTFRTKNLLESVQRALNRPDYKLSQLRYDLSKLRGKGLVERVGGTQQYRLMPAGYRVGVFYCKLYNRLYAPMTASQLAPSAADRWVAYRRRSLLDRLYAALDTALHRLSHYVGLRDSA
jgi:hypothetical protein